MQRSSKQASDFFCATTSLLVSTTLSATQLPPLEITLSSGVGSNIIATYAGQTSIVEYQMQDLIGRLPARTWSLSTPLPAFMSRAQALHQPDCAFYNQNPADLNSFSLPPSGTCYFALQVNGTLFENSYQGVAITYRPVFTNSNGVAYGACVPDIITMTSAATPPPPPPPPPTVIEPLVSVGFYTDSTGSLRPLLVESQDQGITWTYPQSINAPPTNIMPPFTLSMSSLSSASCAGNVCIAVGMGEDGVNILGISPLLALTQDGGNTWTYPDINPPVFTPDNTNAYYTNGNYSSASCSGNVCIGVGNYSTGGEQRPLLVLTQDGGATFSYPSSVNAPTFTNFPYGTYADLVSSSCSGNLCIAAGSYQDTNNATRPLVVASQNSGTSWGYPQSVVAPNFTANPFNNFGVLTSASCSGNICITGGYYTDTNTIQRPLIAVSQDSAVTWTYPESVTTPIFSPTNAFAFANTGFINSVDCVGTHCIAVGSYVDTNNVQRALLASSNNAGSSWTYIESITAPVFVPNNTFPFDSNATLVSLSCYQAFCATVGSYVDTSATQRPLLAYSQDAGASWTYLEPLTAPVFSPTTTNPFASGSFSSVSCNISGCVASGNYTDTSGAERPLVASNTNFGTAWVFPDSVTSPVFTPSNTNPYQGNGNFNGAASGSTS